MNIPDAAEPNQNMKIPMYVFCGGHGGKIVVVIAPALVVIGGEDVVIDGHLGHSKLFIVIAVGVGH
jgi:hypothetical protein